METMNDQQPRMNDAWTGTPPNKPSIASTAGTSASGVSGRMSHGIIELGEPRPVDVDIVSPAYNEEQAL